MKIKGKALIYCLLVRQNTLSIATSLKKEVYFGSQIETTWWKNMAEDIWSGKCRQEAERKVESGGKIYTFQEHNLTDPTPNRPKFLNAHSATNSLVN